LTGCLVDRQAKELKKEFPGVNLFINSKKPNIVKALGILQSTVARGEMQPSFLGHTRAFVKIQDGCNGRCSYCVVPKVRQELWSKNTEDVILEAKNYVKAGHKEIVLCGIRLGKYKSTADLIDLIKKLEGIKGLYRIRLSSIELNDITDSLIGLMSKSSKFCHHLHIPLQSGDDTILKDMNRPYNTSKFFNKIKNIRKKVPDVGLTTDIIIGYPTDTDKTLNGSYYFVKKCAFSRLHIFKFSRRPGTKANLIGKDCPQALAKKWQGKFKYLDSELRKKFFKKFSNKKMEILTEENGYGYTSNYLYLKLPGKFAENEIINI